MNLELNGTTPLVWFMAVVLHEFGHALGCIHKHQNPAAGIQWNKNSVLDYCQNGFNWDMDMVKKNAFDPYEKDMT
jgi:serralysin